jgi:hypothetical protein
VNKIISANVSKMCGSTPNTPSPKEVKPNKVCKIGRERND